MTGFIKGIGDFFFGASTVVRTPSLWPYAVVPVLINTVLYITIIGGGVYFFNDLTALFLPVGDSWYITALNYFLWIVFAVSIILMIFLTFFAVSNVIAAPFNELLSSKYESMVTGVKRGGGLGVTSSLLAEVKRLIFYLFCFALLLILTVLLGLIPGVNIIVPFLWAFFAGFFLAFEFLSYPLERYDMGFSEKLRYLLARLGRIEGFGVAIYLGLCIPLLNFIVIPAAVVGATRIYLDDKGAN